MPSEDPTPSPATTADALASFLRRRGLDMARAELALWDLPPKITREPNGRAALTAFHNSQGKPAVRYQLDATGNLSRKAASDHHTLPNRLRPTVHRRSNAGSRRWDPTKLPDTTQIQYEYAGDEQLLLSCTELIRILRRLLAVRLITRAASIASDYLPNSIVREAINRRDRPSYDGDHPGELMDLAQHLALQAMAEGVSSDSRRRILLDRLGTRTRPRTPWFLSNLLGDTAVQQTPSHPLDSRYTLPPKRVRGTDALAAAAQLNSDLVREFLDQPTLQALLAIDTAPKQSLHARLTATPLMRYNVTHSSLPAYGPLAQTAPGLARLYLHNQGSQRQHLTHPGVIISRLRKAHRLSPLQWRLFHRLANHPRLHTNHLDSLKATARAAALANQPRPTDAALTALHHSWATLDTQRYAHRGRTKTGHRTAWRRILQAFLHPAAAPAPTAPQLRMVYEVMTQRMDAGLPWGPGTWPQLLARAAAWHRSRMEYPPQDEEPWFDPGDDPPEGTHTRLRHRLLPINCQSRLDILQQLLGQPFPQYRTDLDDPLRVFLATAPGTRPALITLRSDSGSWQLDELRATGPRRPSKRIRQVAEDLAAAFREHDPTPARTEPSTTALRGDAWLHATEFPPPQPFPPLIPRAPSFDDILSRILSPVPNLQPPPPDEDDEPENS